jgi:hypothetical protein
MVEEWRHREEIRIKIRIKIKSGIPYFPTTEMLSIQARCS